MKKPVNRVAFVSCPFRVAVTTIRPLAARLLMNSPLALDILKTTTRLVGSADSSALYSEAERSGPIRLNFDSFPSNEPCPIKNKTERCSRLTESSVSRKRLLLLPQWRARHSDVFSVKPVTIRQHRTQLPRPLLELFCVSSLSTRPINNDCILIRINLHRLLCCLRTRHRHASTTRINASDHKQNPCFDPCIIRVA